MRLDRRGVWAGVLRLAWTGLVWSMLVSVAAAAESWRGTVTHVSDGDTLWVRPQAGGKPRSVRLDGIDAPELCQAYGETAREVLATRALGQTVQVRVRVHDDYGRALAHVGLHGEDLGGWLVRHGHAWSYRYRGQSGPYSRLEARARSQRLGLFAEGLPERPREFRRRHGACHH